MLFYDKLLEQSMLQLPLLSTATPPPSSLPFPPLPPALTSEAPMPSVKVKWMELRVVLDWLVDSVHAVNIGPGAVAPFYVDLSEPVYLSLRVPSLQGGVEEGLGRGARGGARHGMKPALDSLLHCDHDCVIARVQGREGMAV
eukprot:366457-Chlamydomonas_euryale.AAC.3